MLACEEDENNHNAKRQLTSGFGSNDHFITRGGDDGIVFAYLTPILALFLALFLALTEE